MTAWYRHGTATVSNGSTTVTLSVGATALNSVRPGDGLVIGLFSPVEIASVTDNNTVELRKPWPNANQSGADYAIIPGAAWSSTATLALEVSEYLSAISGIISSASTLTVDTGPLTLQVPANLRLSVGAYVRISDTDNPTTRFMAGTVTGYAGTTLSVEVNRAEGTGTASSWNINLAGEPGPEGNPGTDGEDGLDGWSPVFAVVTDGDRRVLQVEDWVGGEGTPPAAGKYVGADGLVEDINDAVDIRGPKGQDGAGVGTVTQIDTGAGLSGGPITSSGEISIDIDSLDEETAPDDDDVFIGQRASSGDLYKIKAQNLPGSGGGRELLTAPRTYYVNGSTGSDSNDGLTSGTAFATIQKAVDVVAGLDLGIFDVTTSIAAGTYAEAVVLKPLVGAGRHYIVGDEVTPANVKVHAPPGSDAVYAPSTFSTYHLRGMELQALGSGTFADSAIHLNGNGSVYIRNLRFLECEMAHMRVGAGAYLDTEGDYTIAGDAAYHVVAISGTAQIRLNTVTLVGTPSFSKVGVSAFVWADRLAFVQVTNVTFVGSATGKRYNVSTNSVVYTSVGLQLPGNTAGTATLGGQYV